MKLFWTICCIAAPIVLNAQPKFEAKTIDDKVQIGYGIAIGDVDGDRKPDILLADKKQFVWYRNGDWKRFVLVENLTPSDNVCIAARDIDGDGKVEIAVGAQWNPGETSDTTRSGSVHYLIRPDDPTTLWLPVKLHHEPTIHRMRWAQVAPGRFQLIVVPLHGRGNKDGNGRGVRVFAYEKPRDPHDRWKMQLVDSSMHLTHNFDLVADGNRERLYIGGKEGVRAFEFRDAKWRPARDPWVIQRESFGEIRVDAKTGSVAGIQPMHGNTLTIYDRTGRKTVMASGFQQGHALATGAITDPATVQVLAGWREPDAEGYVGIKLFVPRGGSSGEWNAHWIDQNDMACEDLQVADLNGDQKPDIIAAGRSTHNLKIYLQK